MELSQEQSWDYLTSILALKTTTDEAWNKFIDLHEQVIPASNQAQLRNINVETEQSEIVAWLEQLLIDSPIPKTIAAIWIGLLKFADESKEIPTIYISGSDAYNKNDIDWACEPFYFPENRYAQPAVLQYIDEIFRSDKKSYEFFDWIFPLAYCAFTFDEIFRTKIDKKLIITGNLKIHIVVGYDDGDYIKLTEVE